MRTAIIVCFYMVRLPPSAQFIWILFCKQQFLSDSSQVLSATWHCGKWFICVRKPCSENIWVTETLLCISCSKRNCEGEWGAYGQISPQRANAFQKLCFWKCVISYEANNWNKADEAKSWISIWPRRCVIKHDICLQTKDSFTIPNNEKNEQCHITE